MTSEVQRMERLAERLRAVDPVAPSPGAKIRGWNLVLAAVEQSATVRSSGHPVRRLLVAAATVAILLVTGAFAASADSLPDSTLYPLKGVLENIRGALTFSPSDRLIQHLDLAKTRLTEAEAMLARHRVDLTGRTLNALNDQLNLAARLVQNEKQRDPAIGAAMQNRLGQAIATDDKELVVLEGQALDPAAVSAIAQARDRAAEALKVAQAPPSPNSQGSPTASPTGTAQGSPAASPTGTAQGPGTTSSPQPNATP